MKLQNWKYQVVPLASAGILHYHLSNSMQKKVDNFSYQLC